MNAKPEARFDFCGDPGRCDYLSYSLPRTRTNPICCKPLGAHHRSAGSTDIMAQRNIPSRASRLSNLTLSESGNWPDLVDDLHDTLFADRVRLAQRLNRVRAQNDLPAVEKLVQQIRFSLDRKRCGGMAAFVVCVQSLALCALGCGPFRATRTRHRPYSKATITRYVTSMSRSEIENVGLSRIPFHCLRATLAFQACMNIRPDGRGSPIGCFAALDQSVRQPLS